MFLPLVPRYTIWLVQSLFVNQENLSLLVYYMHPKIQIPPSNFHKKLKKLLLVSVQLFVVLHAQIFCAKKRKKCLTFLNHGDIIDNVETRVCWNRQTGTFEGRVSSTYEFKSRHSHQKPSTNWSMVFLFFLYFLIWSSNQTA